MPTSLPYRPLPSTLRDPCSACLLPTVYLGKYALQVKTLYNDTGRIADRVVILMVLLYVELRIRLISRKKEVDTWPDILKGCRVSTLQAKQGPFYTKSLLVIMILVGKT